VGFYIQKYETINYPAIKLIKYNHTIIVKLEFGGNKKDCIGLCALAPARPCPPMAWLRRELCVKNVKICFGSKDTEIKICAIPSFAPLIKAGVKFVFKSIQIIKNSSC